MPARLAWILVFCCLGIGGCGSKAAEPESPTAKKLQQIGAAYVRATIRLNHPPKKLADMQSDLRDQGKVTEILRSPGDGEPFEIIWGVELRRLTATGSAVPVVAFEKTGKDGKRHVLRGDVDVFLMSEGELKAAVVPPGYQFPF